MNDLPSEPGTVRRRSRNSLNRDVIVRTALEAYRGEDVSSMTFQKLGRHLEAHPTAIYRHFRDKDDLLLTMLDALQGEALDEAGPVHDDWADELRAVADGIYRTYRRYPAITRQIGTRTTRRIHEFTGTERVLGALRRAGFSDEEAGRHFRPFMDLVLGYACLDASLDALPSPQRDSDLQAWDTDYRSVPAASFPVLAVAGRYLGVVGDPANFTLALDLHLAAVRELAGRGQ